MLRPMRPRPLPALWLAPGLIALGLCAPTLSAATVDDLLQ